MRFTQYLVEEQDQTQQELTQAAESVAKYCQPYLKEINQDVELALQLKRGMKEGDGNFFINNTRKDRRPMNTPPAVHQFVDQWFEQNFNCKFRSNGLFATGDHHSATYYGFPYIVFPIGQFTYVWTPNIKDLFGRLNNKFEEELQQPMIKVDDQDQLYYDQQDLVEEILQQADYRSHSLDKAIKSGAEIMFCVDRYFALKLNNKQEHQFFQQQLQKQLQ